MLIHFMLMFITQLVEGMTRAIFPSAFKGGFSYSIVDIYACLISFFSPYLVVTQLEFLVP